MAIFRSRLDQSGQPWERRRHDRWYRPRRGADPASRAEQALRDRQAALSVVAAQMRAASGERDWQQVLALGGLHSWLVLGNEAPAERAA